MIPPSILLIVRLSSACSKTIYQQNKSHASVLTSMYNDFVPSSPDLLTCEVIRPASGHPPTHTHTHSLLASFLPRSLQGSHTAQT